jgi:hypothetical protein
LILSRSRRMVWPLPKLGACRLVPELVSGLDDDWAADQIMGLQ